MSTEAEVTVTIYVVVVVLRSDVHRQFAKLAETDRAWVQCREEEDSVKKKKKHKRERKESTVLYVITYVTGH
jgi:hypothetical protein